MMRLQTKLRQEEVCLRESYLKNVGLDSRVYESGTSIHGKGYISKRGSKILRTRFYNAADVAVLHENIVDGDIAS